MPALPPVVQVLLRVQPCAADALSVFCGVVPVSLLWCAGLSHQSQGRPQTEQTHQGSWICGWLLAGLPGGGAGADTQSSGVKKNNIYIYNARLIRVIQPSIDF